MRILFLDASTDVLVRRYESTRRRHPAGRAASGLVEAIERERELLEPVKEGADVVVDTTEPQRPPAARPRDSTCSRRRNRQRDADHACCRSVTSTASRVDVDMVIDCRFLPNPHWVDELRPLTGLDEPVRDYVFAQPATEQFLERLTDLLDLLLPAYEAEGKAYLSIAFGCTGGRHRSVAIAEEVASRMRTGGAMPRVAHRDLAKT